MSTKLELEKKVNEAKHELAMAEFNLDNFMSSAENNRFEDLIEACSAVEDVLLTRAGDDCEWSHKCGRPSYAQEFMVGEQKYRGTLTVTYNRHDKTYYYVDGSSFSYEASN